jgi:hypothetical protein
MAYLVITQSGHDESVRHALTGQPITIGRAVDCDMAFPGDKGLSRRHCTIGPVDLRAPKQWVVTDLDSSNGTRVGSTYVERQELKDGDEIYAGDLKIVFFAAGFVGKRPDRPDDLPAADSPVLKELLARSKPRTSAEPRPMPRAARRPHRPVPSPEAAASLADTAQLPRHSVAFERPAAAPRVAAPEGSSRHRHPLGWAVGGIAAAAIAAATWVLLHHS